MATHFCILAWRIQWTEEPGRLQSMGSQRIRQDWVSTARTLYFSTLHPKDQAQLLCMSSVWWCLGQTYTAPVEWAIENLRKRLNTWCVAVVLLLSPVWLFVTLWTAAHTPSFPVLHYLPEFAQTHVHCVSDAIQSSHPLSPLLLLQKLLHDLLAC